jgi:septal ring factor EnvC (AmiA/AmiB activator)
MRQVSLPLLVVLMLSCTSLHAEPDAALATRNLQAEIDALQQRLAESEALREELQGRLQESPAADLNAQSRRLRQENQRLKLQLKAAQAGTPQPLLSEQQTWYAIGAGSSLLAVLLGALLRGGRRPSRQWLN